MDFVFRLRCNPRISHYAYVNIPEPNTLLVLGISGKGHFTWVTVVGSTQVDSLPCTQANVEHIHNEVCRFAHRQEVPWASAWGQWNPPATLWGLVLGVYMCNRLESEPCFQRGLKPKARGRHREAEGKPDGDRNHLILVSNFKFQEQRGKPISKHCAGQTIWLAPPRTNTWERHWRNAPRLSV